MSEIVTITPRPFADLQTPEPLGMFKNEIIHPRNVELQARQQRAKLLTRDQRREYTRQAKLLKKKIDHSSYPEIQQQLRDLHERYLAVLEEVHWAGDRVTPELQTRLDEIQTAARNLKRQRSQYLPVVREYKALKQALQDHEIAVAREQLHKRLTLQMAKESAVFARIIKTELARLDIAYKRTIKGRTVTDTIKFERVVTTPDEIQFKIYTGKVGTFGGYIPGMPHGVKGMDIVAPDTLHELTIACKRQVTGIYTQNAGLWLRVHRLGTIDGLPTKVTLGQIEGYYDASQRSIYPVSWGVGQGRQIATVSLLQFPHILIGGASGGGKSNITNAVILQLIKHHSPDEIRLVLVDLKEGQEFLPFEDVPHLLTQPVTEVLDFLNLLGMLETLRKERAMKFAAIRARDLTEYNARVPDEMKEPRIVVLVDEYAAIQIEDKRTTQSIQRLVMQLLNKARAAGINMILCTQNPSTEILPGASKNNIVLRLAFPMPTGAASQTILGTTDAAKLDASIKGRCLLMIGAMRQEIQAPLVTVEDMATALKQAKEYDAPAPLELPEVNTVAAGFSEQELLEVAIDFLGGNLGANPIYNYVKGEEDVTRSQVNNMVKDIVERGTAEYGGITYEVKRHGKGYRLIAPEKPEN